MKRAKTSVLEDARGFSQLAYLTLKVLDSAV